MGLAESSEAFLLFRTFVIAMIGDSPQLPEKEGAGEVGREWRSELNDRKDSREEQLIFEERISEVGSRDHLQHLESSAYGGVFP